MLNVIPVLQHEDIPTTTVCGAVQKVRELIEAAGANAAEEAARYIHMLTDVMPSFEDATTARLAAQYVVEAVIKANGVLECQEDVVATAIERATAFKNDPSHAWMYAVEEKRAATEIVQQVATSVDVKVAVNAEGKIKKGGRQIIVAELYKKHVLNAETPLTNQEFIAILVKELSMTKAGATTYAWNVKKQLGEPAGGIIKSKKGRKPKEA